MSTRGMRRRTDAEKSPGGPLRKRQKKTDPIEILATCNEFFDSIRGIKSEDDRVLCESFMRAPSRRTDPEYHKVVENPIDFARIQQKLKNEEYESFQHFFEDVELVLNNAKKFYQPENQEYQDASDLHERVLELSTKFDRSSNTPANHTPSPAPSASVPNSRRNSPEPEEWKMESVMAAILDLTDPQGRLICPPFRVLASAEEFPTYYEEIETPIDLKTIAKRIRDGAYDTWAAFEADVKLLCKNAKQFNKPGSTIYKDASRIQTCFDKKKAELTSSKRLGSTIATHNKEVIDELLNQVENEETGLSEDSEEDEDSEDSDDPLWILYWTVRNHDVVDGVPLCEPFLELPSKSYYPDYYDEIKRPMSLFMINKRIKRGEYRDLDALVQEMLLIFDNAKSYNIETSEIYQSAVTLEKLVKKKTREFKKERQSPKSAKQETLDESIDFENGDSPSASNLTAASTSNEVNGTPKSPRKRGRPLKNAVEQVDDAASDISSNIATGPKKTPRPRRPRDPNVPKQKPGRKTFEEHRKTYKDKLMMVWNAASDLKMNNRNLSEPFMYLPCDKTYPDYYKIIKHPIDLTEIRRRIETNEYGSSEEMLKDFHTMFSNAREYNMPGSQLFMDSFILESVVNATMTSVTDNMVLVSPPVGKYEGKSKYQRVTDGLPLGSPQPLMREKANKVLRISGNSPAFNFTRASQQPMDFRQPVPAPIRGTPKQQLRDTLDREHQQMLSIYEALVAHQGPDGRMLSTVFMKLPSKTEYPAYYEIIKRPMDLLKVRSKLNSYDSLKSFVADLNLVFDNACKFNDPDSQIYKDALTLQRELLELKSQFTEDSVPCVQTQVRLILTKLLVAITTHTDGESRCLSNSFSELPEIMKKKGAKSEEIPFSLDEIKYNVDKGRYKRMDRFQEDVFALFSKAREYSAVDSQMFQDSVELQLFFITKRDELCKNILSSPAKMFNDDKLHAEVDKVKKAKKQAEETETKLEEPKTEDENTMDMKADEDAPVEELEKSGDHQGQEDLESIEHEGVVYKPNEYVYIASADDDAPPDAPRHIMRIERIYKDEEGVILIRGFWCYRPSETYHLVTRKFFQKEVFLTDYKDSVVVDRLRGKCLVMFVDDYIRLKPTDFVDDDIYICESKYLGNFKPLVQWPYPEEQEALITEERRKPLNLPKVESEFAKKSKETEQEDASSSGLEVNDIRVRSLPHVLDIKREEVLDKKLNRLDEENETTADGNVYYQQLEFNGNFYRLGDGVLVFNDQKAHCDVMRVDKLWKDQNGEKFFSGAFFARPKETKHEMSRMFFQREVIAVEQPDRVEPLEKIQNKCAILTVKQFETSRPTEIPECDVFVMEYKVKASREPCSAKNCSLYSSRSENEAEVQSEAVSEDAIMNMNYSKAHRKLKTYNLANEVPEDEIFYFKEPITMEKELSPLMMSHDGSLPIDHNDLENESRALKSEFPDDEKTSPKDTVSWLASQPKLNAKSKSGYILFSAEVRKRIMNENPEAGFGEVSKIVGVEWKKLTDDQKRQYEVRAQFIADERAKAELLTPTSRLLQPGQVRVFHCKWQMCDFQFDSFNGLYEHVKTSHTSQIMDGDNQYVCLWTSCLKYRKEGKPFPSLPRLHRHIKEKHLPSAGKAIYPNQKGKNFFVYIEPPQSPESNKGGSHSNQANFGTFIHQPYGVATPDAIPCTVATPYPTAQPSVVTTSTSIGHPHPTASTSATPVHTTSVSAHQQNAQGQPTQYIIQQPGSMAGQMPQAAHPPQGATVQYVQATINGSTVYVPAGQQYQTIIVNQVPQGAMATQQPQQTFVVHQPPPSTHSQPQVQSTMPQQGAPQSHVYQQAPQVQQGPSGHVIVQQPPGPSAQPTMNGVGSHPGPSYGHPAPHHPAGPQLQPPPTTSQAQPQVHPQHAQMPGPSTSTAPQPIMDPGRTIVQAPPKPPEPVFVPPPNSIQVKRVMHSETYLRYIESLSNDQQRTVSKWDKNLLATARNTQPSKRLPYDWVRPAANGSKPREEEVVKALWKLRDQLLESTVDISRESDVNF